MTCVPRTAPSFSVRPPSVSIRHQRPEGGSSSPLPSTSVRDGSSASGVVNVATVFIGPNVLSSKSSASVTRTPFPALNASVCAVSSGAASV